MLLKHKNNEGFSVIEGILILVIVAAIVGIGGFVYKHRAGTAGSPSTNLQSAIAPAGTTSFIDQLTQQDSQSESSINTKYDSGDQSAASSTNSAQSDLGGAYNESSL